MPPSRASATVLALVTALPLITAAAPAPAAPTTVAAVELPGLPGQPSHRATAVNDLGQVVGQAEGDGPVRAVQWSPGGAITDLGPGLPTGVNQRGQVVGMRARRDLGPYAQHPRIWFAGGGTDITPPGSGWVITSAINAHGDVPMTYSTSPYGYHQERAAVWRGGVHVVLPMSGPHLSLSAINDAGVVAGSRTLPSGADFSAFRCVGTTCTRLADAEGYGAYSVEAVNEAGAIVGSRGTVALRWEGDAVTVLSADGRVAHGEQALNERGDAVGWSVVDGVRRAVLWPAGGKPVDLGVPGPSEAVAVNERGDVVGWTSAADGSSTRAFHWRAGRVTWLAPLGGTAAFPIALNDRGVVVGESTTAGGGAKPVRWTLPSGAPDLHDPRSAATSGTSDAG
ncbi:hypothetical protein [Saccharothrix sp. Mg75]|uniref:hypothetical protein n=1 Tax=Saccharothrix sp. Mg75 TaxID=3445357 RepID=UPI003EEBF67D